MADTKISNLPEGTPAQGSDNLPVQRGSSNVKLSVADIAAYSSQNPENIPAKTILANLTSNSAPALPATLLQAINALQPTGTKWYVDSVNGNDSNTGTSEFNAFATLDHAQSTANSGDAIYISDGFTLNTQFTVTKALIFCSQGVVNFLGGITIGNVSSRWEGVFYFSSTNVPSIVFTGGGQHYFNEVNISTTYDENATQTIASSIYIPNGAYVFFTKISSLSLVTLTGDQAPPETLTRATHIYTTGSATFNITISDSMHDLNRANNGIQYNIYYSDAPSVYNTCILNNLKISENNSGQSDNTINDLFIGSGGFGHTVLVNTVNYVSASFRIAGPKIRIANSDEGLYRCAIVVNNITIEPSYLENGDIVLSNATTSGDICSVTGCTILGNFTLAASGSGQNIYSYTNSIGEHYTSYPSGSAGVASLNGLQGILNIISANSNATVTTDSQNNIVITVVGGGSAGVSSLNGLLGTLQLLGGPNVTVTTDNETGDITIGVQNINNAATYVDAVLDMNAQPLTATYNNGVSGVGATLTSNTNGILSNIDSIITVLGMRVGVINNQTNAAYNGIYVVTDVGSSSTPWILTRAADFDTVDTMLPGTNFTILEGATYLNGLLTFSQLDETNPAVGTSAALFNFIPSLITDGNVINASYIPLANQVIQIGLNADMSLSQVPVVLEISPSASGYKVLLPSMTYINEKVPAGQSMTVVNASFNGSSFTLCYEDGTLIQEVGSRETYRIVFTSTATEGAGLFPIPELFLLISPVRGELIGLPTLEPDDIQDSSSNSTHLLSNAGLDYLLSTPAVGSMIYKSSTGYVALPPGTAGQVLQTNGTSNLPTWGSPSNLPNTVGAFKLLIANPVVNTFYTLNDLIGFSGSINSVSSFIDTGTIITFDIYRNGVKISPTTYSAQTFSGTILISPKDSFSATDNYQIYIVSFSSSVTNLHIAVAYNVPA